MSANSSLSLANAVVVKAPAFKNTDKDGKPYQSKTGEAKHYPVGYGPERVIHLKLENGTIVRVFIDGVYEPTATSAAAAADKPKPAPVKVVDAITLMKEEMAKMQAATDAKFEALLGAIAGGKGKRKVATADGGTNG